MRHLLRHSRVPASAAAGDCSGRGAHRRGLLSTAFFFAVLSAFRNRIGLSTADFWLVSKCNRFFKQVNEIEGGLLPPALLLRPQGYMRVGQKSCTSV